MKHGYVETEIYVFYTDTITLCKYTSVPYANTALIFLQNQVPFYFSRLLLRLWGELLCSVSCYYRQDMYSHVHDLVQ